MEKLTTAAYEPLLEEQSGVAASKYKGARWAPAKIFSLVLLPALLVYTAAVLTLNLLRGSEHRPSIYSPANVVLHYEITDAWDRGESSKWLHGPQAETDAAWASLVDARSIRVSEDDMYRTQREFEKVNDALELGEGGYLGTLGSVLRVALNRDGYNVTDPEAKQYLQLPHLYHCIDALRADVMCQPDLTVYYGLWLKSHKELRSKNIRSRAQRQCAAWGPIASWSEARALHENRYTLKPGPYDTE